MFKLLRNTSCKQFTYLVDCILPLGFPSHSHPSSFFPNNQILGGMLLTPSRKKSFVFLIVIFNFSISSTPLQFDQEKLMTSHFGYPGLAIVLASKIICWTNQ